MSRWSSFGIGVRFLSHYFRDLHPYEVSAQIWNSCDQKCVYCRCPNVKTSLMTTEQWMAVICRLRALGTIRIKFQGGEPILKPDFPVLCRTAKAAGLITAVVSNGISIAAQPELLEGLDELVISLDSIRPEVNDGLRGKGAFAGARKAIDLALSRGIRTYVNMALTQKNLEDLDSLLVFCEGRGMRMNAQPIKFGTEYYDEGARSIALTPEQIRNVHRQLSSWKKQGRGLMFSPQAYRKALEWPDLNTNTIQSSGYSKCMAGRYYFHIDPDGDVIPCIPHGGGFSPKNVLRDGVDEALRHARYHKCGDCWSAYLNERKSLYALRASALREFIKRK